MSEDDPLDPPWYSEYDDFNIPETLEPYPEEPAHELLYTAGRDHPYQGVVQLGAKYSYPEIVDQVNRLATALEQRGIEKGDRVATVLPTSVQFLIATNGISRAGGVHVPNDFLESEDDLIYRLERSQPSVLIGQEGHRDLMSRLREELDIEHLVLTSIDGYSADPPDTPTAVDGIEWLREVICETEPNPPEITFEPNDVHTLLFTGGTTGTPKGCRLTQRNLYANALQSSASQSNMAQLLRGQESAIMALPMYHAYGYAVTHTLLELGLDMLVVPDGRDTEMMIELIEARDPIIMLGVPTQFMELVEEQLDQEIIGLSGSAPLANTTRSEFEEQSTGISQGYGLSEMTAITHFNTRGLLDMMTGQTSATDGFEYPTIGVPIPDTEVKLVDVETREEIPIARAIEEELEGEMFLNGPQRMAGYLDESIDPFDADGYVETGDVVKIDRSGRFYVVDRVKNMINVSGLKVYTAAVDEVLLEHPGVRRPATIGVPDPDRPGSERVKIYIEPASDELTAERIRDHLDGRVPRQAMPDSVEFIEEIPLTDVGKVDKKTLKETRDTAVGN